MSFVNSLSTELSDVVFSSANMHKAALDYLTDLQNGSLSFTDPTNPFVYLIEVATAAVNAGAIRAEAIHKELYPELASSFSELYRHMSDTEALDRFAIPAKNAVISLLFDADEIERYAVLDSATNLSRIRIPGDTAVTANGMSFYGHWPIDIITRGDYRFQVTYDLSEDNPLITPTTNKISHTVQRVKDRRLLVLQVPMEQLRHTLNDYPISNTTGFSVDIPYSDDFYAIRVYHSYDNETWEEILVSHSTMVYDPSVLTAVVKVTEGVVSIHLPEIYLSTSIVGTSLRARIYTTMGEVDNDITALANTGFDISFNKDTETDTKFTAPLDLLGFYSAVASEGVSGGRNALTFEELKDRIVYGKNEKSSLVSPDELRAQLSSEGYSLAVIKETVLGKVFLTSKEIVSINPNIIGIIGCALGIFRFDKEDTTISNVIRVGADRTTILPTALYERKDEAFTIVSDTERERIEGLTGEFFVEEINTRELFYQPFYVVIDSSEGSVQSRIYNMTPKEVSRSFVAANDQLALSVNTTSISVSVNENGFTFVVTAEVPSGMEGLYLQPAFYTIDTGERFYLEPVSSTIDGTVATSTFSLDTTFDVTAGNKIYMSNLINSYGAESPEYMLIKTGIDLIYLTETDSKLTSDFDDKYEDAFFDVTVSAVTHEQVIYTLSDQLDSLYCRIRPILKPPVYQTYNDDEVKVYDKDIYEEDEDGVIFEQDPETKKVTFNIIHAKGDTVLDADGEPIYVHRAGDYVYDENGDPVIINDVDTVREVRLPLIDADYRYGTTANVVTSKDLLKRTITQNVIGDIASYNQRMLENQTLFFTPKNTNTKGLAALSNGKSEYVPTTLSFVMDFVVVKGTAEDTSRLEIIKNISRTAIRNLLAKREISTAKLTNEILNNVDSSVIGLDVNQFVKTGFAKLLNDNDFWNVNSRLVYLSNGRFDVVDDITFTFTSPTE